MIDSLYPLLVCGATSALLALLAHRRSPGLLRTSVARALEWIGLTTLFLMVNVTVGMLSALVVRRLSGTFVSLYANVDVMMMVLSALQAAVAQWWWAEKTKDRVPPKSP